MNWEITSELINLKRDLPSLGGVSAGGGGFFKFGVRSWEFGVVGAELF
jgi:hypothetical protein